MKFSVLVLAVAGSLVAPFPAAAQGARKAAPAAVRTVKGNMRGNVIAVRTDADRPVFDYVITGVRVADGRLEFEGTLRPTGRKAGPGGAASATLVGTLAKEPAPGYAAARAKRLAAQRGTGKPASSEPAAQPPGGPTTTTETAGRLGELSQSTQSTARTTPEPVAPEGERPKEDDRPAADGGATGCEVIFMRMTLPAQYASTAGSRTVQLNVALARLDNQAGVALNRRICRVLLAIESGGDAVDAEVAELNRLLGGAR